MQLLSFLREGTNGYGAVKDDGVIDLSRRLGERYATLRDLLDGGLEAATDVVSQNAPDFALAGLTFDAPIPNPDKIICVGVNYENHRIETGRAPSEYPTLFTRFANTLTGHDQPIFRPQASTRLDFEGELAVIIGQAGRHIAEADALDYVVGYACFNDATVRDWQNHSSQFTPGKNFYRTGGFGPYLVTADAINNPSDLTLTTRLNGQVMQQESTGDLIFTIPQLISYISTFTPLAVGDVIATGTPGGVGFKRDPQVFMKAGDNVEVEISGLGTLRNVVIDEVL